MSGAQDYRKRIARIKENVTMSDLVRHYGGDVWNDNRECQVRCILPDHVDRNPSARIFPDSNVLHCFVCGFHGDVIDVVKKCESVDGLGAIEYLEREFNLLEIGLPDFVDNKFSVETLERYLKSDLERIVSDKLWKVCARIPKHKKYIWWIWSDWIWFLFENRDELGGLVPWYNSAREYINKYLVPLSKEFDETVFIGVK